MKTEFDLLRVLLLSALFLGGCGAYDAPGLEEDGIAHLTYWSSQNPGERRLAVAPKHPFHPLIITRRLLLQDHLSERTRRFDATWIVEHCQRR